MDKEINNKGQVVEVAVFDKLDQDASINLINDDNNNSDEASLKPAAVDNNVEETDCEDNPTKYLYKSLSMIVDPFPFKRSTTACCLNHHSNEARQTTDDDLLTTQQDKNVCTNRQMSISVKTATAENNKPTNRNESVSTNDTFTTNTNASMADYIIKATSDTNGNNNNCAIIDTQQQHNVVISSSDLLDDDNNGECSRRNSHSIPERNLLYCSLERIKLKDFGCEIRALMDVEQFVHQAILLLDVTDIIVEDIVDNMLRKIISVDRDISQRVINDAKNALFIHKSASLLSRTIQGIQISTDPMLPGLDYDQSWLCSMCNLPTISKRHVAIARLKHFVNMGKNAHEVRFFILIVTPSKEKGTKNALETGRTFATIFSDIDFRQVLLNAHNETEFKNALLSYTKKLSNANTTTILDDYNSCQSTTSTNNAIGATQLDSLYKLQYPAQLQQQTNTHSDAMQLHSTCSYQHQHHPSRYLAPTSAGQQQNSSGCGGQANQSPLLITIVNNNTSNNNSTATVPNSSSLVSILATSDEKRIKQQQQQTVLANDESVYKVVVPNCHQTKKTVCLKLSKIDKRRKHVIGNGLCADIKRRIKFYKSDFFDGFRGAKTVHKTTSTIVFLYFGILLPTIAFGVLNTTNTNGKLGDIRKAIIGQSIGGFLFALLGGQPLVIIMTTAPLCLYTKVIYTMCEDYNYPFLPMYAAVGLWNAFFLILYSVFDVSRLMKWCTRSTEEIFALFIAIAFGVDAGRDLIKNFNRYYYSSACLQANQPHLDLISHRGGLPPNASIVMDNSFNSSSGSLDYSKDMLDLRPVCRRESSLLFIILMFGTLWLALALYKFNRTPYLQASKRDMLADYALPSAVIVMSFVGSYVFEEIYVEKFAVLEEISFVAAKLDEMPAIGFLVAMGLGFTLSLLFFMDQNISAAMVNSPQNKLKKGCAYHYDLLVVGLLNGLLTLYGLPMMHGVLPHSPLHVRSLADVEERVEQGHVKEIIINVRETRVTGIVSHILICMSIFLIPYPIAYIPTAVLDGLFLYMAATSLDGLQMFERITLLFMEQSAYPPNHYIRRCPQRKIHEFTLVQLFQLLVMCFFGFSPSNTIEMFFPVVILLMLPFRNKLVPHYIEDKYLEALDGEH